MAIYAIGDVQGCLQPLLKLLVQIDFRADRDQLWFVGDLVNRGPDSLGVLRYVRDLGAAAVAVLGNHDLHLLAMAAGNPRDQGNASLRPVLDAPDGAELIDWLQRRPLLHRDKALGFTMIHAGLPPQWKPKQARRLAAELEAVLRGPRSSEFLLNMYGNEPDLWNDDLAGMDRLRFVTNAFTRLRYCDADGRMALAEKGPPGSQAEGLVPWFEHPRRASVKKRYVCGHWSTLGYRETGNVWSIDTGCLWGRVLTALRLDSEPPVATQLACDSIHDPMRFADD